MSTDLIIDIVATAFGLYLIWASIYMWKNKKINSMIVTETELKRCKDSAPFVNYLSPRMLIFAIITMLVGGVGIVSDTIIDIGYWRILQLAVFLISFTVFSVQLKKARTEYCS